MQPLDKLGAGQHLVNAVQDFTLKGQGLAPADQSWKTERESEALQSKSCAYFFSSTFSPRRVKTAYLHLPFPREQITDAYSQDRNRVQRQTENCVQSPAFSACQIPASQCITPRAPSPCSASRRAPGRAAQSTMQSVAGSAWPPSSANPALPLQS